MSPSFLIRQRPKKVGLFMQVTLDAVTNKPPCFSSPAQKMPISYRTAPGGCSWSECSVPTAMIGRFKSVHPFNNLKSTQLAEGRDNREGHPLLTHMSRKWHTILPLHLSVRTGHIVLTLKQGAEKCNPCLGDDCLEVTEL